MEFPNSSLRVRDARGYSPENHQQHPSFRTRPRPAGVSGILQFLILRVRDARGYTPENHQRIPSFRTRLRPAGVSGIFKFLFSACEDARGYGPENHQRTTREPPAFVPARVPRA